MKRNIQRAVCLTVMAGFILPLCGCDRKTPSPNSYVDGSDYQYFMESRAHTEIKLQQCDGVLYLLNRGFVYFLDEQTGVIMPLCNKADCLHDSERDSEKREECNAYVGGCYDWDSFYNEASQIACCNGYIYCIPYDPSPDRVYSVYRLALDGSMKEAVYAWDQGDTVENWLVHRDVLYAGVDHYEVTDDEVVCVRTIEALPLTGVSPKPEIIYSSRESEEDGIAVFDLNVDSAYGNYVNFDILGDSVESGDNYYREFAYNIENGEVTDMPFPGLPKNAIAQTITYWQDKRVFMIYYLDRDRGERTSVYLSELDGSNPQLLLDDFKQGIQHLRGDGKYLYIMDEESGIYTVLDEDLNTVDTFTTPEYLDYFFCTGKGDRSYQIVDIVSDGQNGDRYDFGEYSRLPKDTTGWGVLVWDKSNIGTYHGGEISFTEILR